MWARTQPVKLSTLVRDNPNPPDHLPIAGPCSYLQHYTRPTVHLRFYGMLRITNAHSAPQDCQNIWCKKVVKCWGHHWWLLIKWTRRTSTVRFTLQQTLGKWRGGGPPLRDFSEGSAGALNLPADVPSGPPTPVWEALIFLALH